MIKRPFLQISEQKMGQSPYTQFLRLGVQMFKVHKNMSSELMQGIFCVS